MPAQTIEGFALSLQQKRTWSFLAEAPETELISQAEYTLRGKLDSGAVEQALRRVIERHEILRSVCKTIPGLSGPVQVVEQEIELRGKCPDGRAEQPVIDWELENRSSEEHMLRIRLSAISADYTTLGLFMEELANEYQRVLSEEPAADEPMQYPDYAQWQAELQTSSEAASGLRHWRNFAMDEVQTKLALERPVPGFKIGHERRSLDAALWEQIERAAHTSGATPPLVVATAWAAFCASLQEGQSPLVIGIETPGRNFEELQKALGPYDRYLPLRVKLNENASVAMAVEAVRSAHTTARHHEDFYAGAGLISCLFAHRLAESSVSAGDLQFEFREASSHSEPFKLKLELTEGSEDRAVEFFYNAERFAQEYGRVLADRFHAFLSAFTVNVDALLSTSRCISSTEMELTTQKFPRSGVVELADPNVLEAFERAARQHPQRPALICGGKILTYGELQTRTNRLGNMLLKLGVAPGDPVAISAERSFEMIAGLLGIQKAGGAYVPLDPAYPRDRLQFILEDCGAKVLVAPPALLSKLPAHSGQTVALAEENPQLRAQESSAPQVVIGEEQPAYIIYTSGSTGQPKGVAITHRNLACSTAARLAYYQEPLANYLLLSSFAFDSSIAGIFWCLAQGATLTIPEEGTQNDPSHLVRLIRAYRVSHLLALPSFYGAILDRATREDLESLTTVIVAGEACAPELIQRHYDKAAGAELYNEYGPTEGTVWATVHRCERGLAETTVPIGRPVPNMLVYILNEGNQPSGVGQLGEIHIGGPAVAQGYMNRAELTAQKFVRNPFAQGEAETNRNVPAMLYRTGDLGCFRADGTIEFHGRIDEQVKIRGYRIEIGEIENVLARHPDVREAVLVAREDAPGEKRLVAYLVPKDRGDFSIPDLRLFAQEKLPQFMIPAQFVVLKALPLTPNGKVDRKALPAPEELDRQDRKRLAPRNRDEEMLAQIWAEVLKLEEVGREENFFDLGGHSLLAIQVIARVRDAFRLDLPMASFFEAPTIEGMAAALGRCRDGNRTTGGQIRRAVRVAASEDLLARQGASAK
jgi:amino acid adenylation domain-containing protein